MQAVRRSIHHREQQMAELLPKLHFGMVHRPALASRWIEPAYLGLFFLTVAVLIWMSL